MAQTFNLCLTALVVSSVYFLIYFVAFTYVLYKNRCGFNLTNKLILFIYFVIFLLHLLVGTYNYWTL